jgi:hypothetical protein
MCKDRNIIHKKYTCVPTMEETVGPAVYMREGPTSRVTAADRPYGEFYDFYSVIPENCGSTLVLKTNDILTSHRNIF